MPALRCFIETSVLELLTTNALVCPSCSFRLRIDRMKSLKAFEVMRKAQAAKDNLEQENKSDNNHWIISKNNKDGK